MPSKLGIVRPVVIPKYTHIGLDIVRHNMRTAGMSRDRCFEWLGEF